MQTTLATRLKAALSRAKTSAKAASLKAGFSETFVKDVLNGREPGVYRLQALARVLGTTVGDLLAEPPASVDPSITMVPVLGHLAAGVWRESREISDDAVQFVPIPSDMLPRGGVLYAARVEGTSMNMVYPPNSLVILRRSFETASELVPGQRYHVERIAQDGTVEQTLKKVVRRADGTVWLVPESTDPEFLQPVPAVARPGESINFPGRVVAAITRAE